MAGLAGNIDWTTLSDALTAGIDGAIAFLTNAVQDFSWAQETTKKFIGTINNLATVPAWDTLGATLANLLNGAFDVLKTAVTDFAWTDVAKKFVGTINNLATIPAWDTLGATLGQLISGSFDGLFTVVSAFEWGQAGKKFQAAVANLVAKVDWDVLGATLAALLNGALDFLNGAVGDFAWAQEAVKKFVGGVNNLVAKVDWDVLGTTLANLLNGSLDTLAAGISSFDWGDNAKKFIGAVNNLVAKVDWGALGRTLAALLGEAFDVLREAVSEFDWGESATSFAEAVNGFFSNENLWSDAGTIVSNAIKGLFTWGKDFLDNLDTKQISNDIKVFMSKLDWAGIAQAIWGFLKAALQALGDLAVDLLSPIQEQADDYELVIGATGEVYFVPKPGEGMHIEGDHWELDEPAEGDLDVSLEKDGWTSIESFIGTAVTVLTSLGKNGWTTIGAFVGTAVTVLTSLGRNGWTSIGGFVGTAVTVYTSLARNGWTSIGGFIGTAVTVYATLAKKDKNQTPDKVFDVSSTLGYLAKLHIKEDKYKPKNVFDNGDTFGYKGTLKATNKTKDVFDNSITVKATLSNSIGNLSGWVKKIANAISNAIKKITGKSEGGAITSGGREINFASGGVIRGGMVEYLNNVPHYAGGTNRAHGTVFVAGENGPEIMGHINGRTEILNKSQLAQAIYSAVVAGMGQAVSALGTFLANQMATCANAITETIGNVGGVAGLRGLEYHAPVMATGSVLPYEVSAQIAKTGEDIQDTLNANNEDLIQTIISAAGQIVAAVQAAGRSNAANDGAGGLTVQQVIRQINRNTQMLGRSPLLD